MIDADDEQPPQDSPVDVGDLVDVPVQQPGAPEPPPAFGTERIQHADFTPEGWTQDDEDELRS